jgi:hypothetical protein
MQAHKARGAAPPVCLSCQPLEAPSAAQPVGRGEVAARSRDQGYSRDHGCVAAAFPPAPGTPLTAPTFLGGHRPDIATRPLALLRTPPLGRSNRWPARRGALRDSPPDHPIDVFRPGANRNSGEGTSRDLPASVRAHPGWVRPSRYGRHQRARPGFLPWWLPSAQKSGPSNRGRLPCR